MKKKKTLPEACNKIQLNIKWKHGLQYIIEAEPRLLNSVLKHYKAIPYIEYVMRDGEIVEYKAKQRSY